MVGKQIKKEHTPEFLPLTVTTTRPLKVRNPCDYKPIGFLQRSMVGTLRQDGTFVGPLDFKIVEDLLQTEPPARLEGDPKFAVNQATEFPGSYFEEIWGELADAAKADPKAALEICIELSNKGKHGLVARLASEIGKRLVSEYAWANYTDASDYGANSSLYLTVLSEQQRSGLLVSEIIVSLLKDDMVADGFIFSAIGVLAERGRGEDIILIGEKACGLELENKYCVKETDGARAVLCAAIALEGMGRGSDAEKLREIWNGSHARLKLEDEEAVFGKFERPYALLFNELQNRHKGAFTLLDGIEAPNGFFERLAGNLNPRFIHGHIFEDAYYFDEIAHTRLFGNLVIDAIRKGMEMELGRFAEECASLRKQTCALFDYFSDRNEGIPSQRAEKLFDEETISRIGRIRNGGEKCETGIFAGRDGKLYRLAYREVKDGPNTHYALAVYGSPAAVLKEFVRGGGFNSEKQKALAEKVIAAIPDAPAAE